MQFISLLFHIFIHIILLPLSITGGFFIVLKPKIVSKKLGVSSTGVSVIGNRWMMHTFGIRKDITSVKLFKALPNSSVLGMWFFFFPEYLSYKISGRNSGITSLKETGKETIKNVGVSRDIHFDRFINEEISSSEQIIILGAGYDTRCYGNLNRKGLSFFEIDEPSTQTLKRKCLEKSGLCHSHVNLVKANFSDSNWFESLINAGYDCGKKSIFVWQGVTPYLSESDVRSALRIIKKYSSKESIIIVDFYAPTGLHGLRMIQTDKEKFKFSIDIHTDKEKALEAFIGSEELIIKDYCLMGDKTSQGAFGVVAKIGI